MPLPKRTKKKTVRAAPRTRRGDKLSAPKWEGWEEWDGQKFHRFKGASREFYYQNYKPADLFPHTFKWMESNGYTKEDIKHAKAANCPIIVAINKSEKPEALSLIHI